MPSTLTGQWFAERWNMWLKGTIENLIQKNTDSSFDSLDTTILNLREWTEKKYVGRQWDVVPGIVLKLWFFYGMFSAPWKCDGLVEISSIYELAENDKISSLFGNSFRIFPNAI